MKSLKKFIPILTIALFLATFISCKEDKTVRDIYLINNDDIDFVKVDEDKKVTVRKDYYGTYSFSNWNSYNVVNIQVHQVENLDYNSSIQRIENMKNNISKLPTTIPNWLKTDEVLENIDEVQEEYATLLEEKDESTKIIRENWEELSNEFYDLREELSETIQEYEME